MNNIVEFPERSRIQEEASYWLIRLDSGSLSDEETVAFSEWLHTSTYHRDTIVELCRLWDNMEMLYELSVLFPNIGRLPSRPVKSSFFRPVFIMTSAAALLLMVGLVFLQYQSGTGESRNTIYQPYETAFQTAIGEQKNIVLPDGSSAHLNTNSLVIVNYSGNQRGVRLVRGEVYFKVAHESDRPFLVHAGDGVVRAVGTAFSVRLKGKNIEVTVTEGKVEVSPVIANKMEDGLHDLSAPVSGESLTILGAGQSAEFSENVIPLQKSVEPEIMSRKLSWQHGMLEFKGETLEQVVSEISRYTDTRIIISDERIRDISIGGYFRAGETEALLSVLESGFPIVISRIDDNLIYLAGEQDANLN